MKNIYFEKATPWFWTAILVLSLMFVLLGTFECIDFTNLKINKRLTGIGFILQAIYFTRMFWYKNYVQWNKRSALVKINTFTGKSLHYKNIKAAVLKDNQLVITKFNDRKQVFHLKNVAKTDTEKLYKIIVNHMSANTI